MPPFKGPSWIYDELGKLYPTDLPRDAVAWRVDELVRGIVRPRDGLGRPLRNPPADLLEAGKLCVRIFQQLDAVLRKKHDLERPTKGR